MPKNPGKKVKGAAARVYMRVSLTRNEPLDRGGHLMEAARRESSSGTAARRLQGRDAVAA
jgi:hypothetical protein